MEGIEQIKIKEKPTYKIKDIITNDHKLKLYIIVTICNEC